MIKKIYFLLLIILAMQIHGRSLHRPYYQFMPEIVTNWHGSKQLFSMKSPFLQEYPIFKLFDEKFFYSHLLPAGTIPYRNDPTKSVKGETLTALIENLLEEIKENKKKFTDFDVLQWKDYNRRKHYGLIVLKFKDYPFVLKLFIETPESLTAPFDKGIEPIFLFCMGGGINRHMTGFTRIPNLEIINERLSSNPYWQDKVTTPRKWYWLSKNTQWIDVQGKYINQNCQKLKTTIPGTYAIIADFIECDRKFSLLNHNDKAQSLELCNYLELLVDPHIENFMIEKDSKKIAIVDTEHFLTIVGLEKVTKEYKNYGSWYLELAVKCLKDSFFCTKKNRIETRKRSSCHWPFARPTHKLYVRA